MVVAVADGGVTAAVRGQVEDQRAEHGLDVDQALQFIGGADSSAEFWVCTSCDNAGVLGGAMGSF